MKTTCFSWVILTASMFVFSFQANAQKKEKDKVLVNKIYTVELTETNVKKPKPIADEISFKGEKMSSKFFSSEFGFPSSPYTVTVDSSTTPHVVTFEATGKNSGSEELKVTGTVTGESIEGDATVTNKKGKSKGEFHFIGNLKEKPGKKKKE